MKRYKPGIVNRIDSVEYMDTCGIAMREDPNGEYVKWEDVTELPDKWIRNGFGQWGVCTCDTTPCTCRAPICNCEEMVKGKMAEYPHMLMEAWWICPAHGYKRR